MTAAAECLDASTSLRLDRVDPLDGRLCAWLAALAARTPHFSHAALVESGCYLGIFAGLRLLSVIGFTACADGTIFVDSMACEPSKAGKTAMVVLAAAMTEQWRDRPIRFFCEINNRKMRRIVESFGAKPAALLYQRGPA